MAVMPTLFPNKNKLTLFLKMSQIFFSLFIKLLPNYVKDARSVSRTKKESNRKWLSNRRFKTFSAKLQRRTFVKYFSQHPTGRLSSASKSQATLSCDTNLVEARPKKVILFLKNCVTKHICKFAEKVKKMFFLNTNVGLFML